MNKNDKLTKKERKRYSALITDKLEKMGVRDEAIMASTGKFKPFFRMNPEGKVNIVDGKPDIVHLEMLTVKNPLRAMVKNLRNSTRSAVEAFLALEVKGLVVPEPELPVTVEKPEGVLIDEPK